MELNQVTLPAIDVTVSIDFYTRMGFVPIVIDEHYARFQSTVGTATFSVHAVSMLVEPSPTTIYFECVDLDADVARLQKAGFHFRQQPTMQPWLWREALLDDPSGNVICRYFAGVNRLDPPWRVKQGTEKPN